MVKLTSSIGICFVSSNLYEIHETVSDGRTNINSFWVPRQDIRTYADNLIYDVTFQVNVAKKIFQCVAALFWKKPYIFSFPNQLKFDDSNICAKLLRPYITSETFIYKKWKFHFQAQCYGISWQPHQQFHWKVVTRKLTKTWADCFPGSFASKTFPV